MAKGDVLGQRAFIHSLFGIAAYERRGDFILNPILARERDGRAREIGRGTEPLALF